MVPTAMSALRVAMDETTPDQKMLKLLLQCGANPFIPDSTGTGCPDHHATPDMAIKYIILLICNCNLLTPAAETAPHCRANRHGVCLDPQEQPAGAPQEG